MEKIYVSFHIGRGGRFHNHGFVTFRGEYDFQKLLQICSDVLFDVRETFDDDGNEIPLPEDEWYVHDGSGRKLLEGRKEMEAKEGVLDFDGEYDMDSSSELEHCSEREWDALRRALGHDFMSDGLKNAIIEHFGIEEEDED